MQIFYHSYKPILERTSVALGMFDGVHLGHRQVLQSALSYAHKHGLKSLVVTMNDHPCKYTQNCHPVLITPLKAKLALFEAMGFDYAYVLNFEEKLMNTSAKDYLDQYIFAIFNAKFISIGYDHFFGKNKEGDAKFLKNWSKAHEIQAQIIPAFYQDSTLIKSSIIRDLISCGKIQEANQYLGYEFFILARVIHGDKRGRKLGYPTANLELAEYQLLPSFGVYQAFVIFDSRQYLAVLNLGLKPSFDEDKVSLEVHLLDFEQDLYGKELKVIFAKKIRNEIKFDNVDDLCKQIQQDIASVNQSLI